MTHFQQSHKHPIDQPDRTITGPSNVLQTEAIPYGDLVKHLFKRKDGKAMMPVPSFSPKGVLCSINFFLRKEHQVVIKRLMAINQIEAIVEAVPRLDALPDESAESFADRQDNWSGGTMLEWGGGGSTLEFLQRLQAGQTLITIEHNASFADGLKREGEALEPECTWQLIVPPLRKEVLQFHRGMHARIGAESPAGLNPYISPDCPLNGVDVFLIDGLARGCCASLARCAGKPESKIFLHDANRYWYDWARAGFSDERIIKPGKDDYSPLLAELIR